MLPNEFSYSISKTFLKKPKSYEEQMIPFSLKRPVISKDSHRLRLTQIFLPLCSLLVMSFCFSHSSYSKVLDEIEREHRARSQKFDLDREDSALVSHTTNIAHIFSDPTQINYKRTTTDQEKKRAFKVLMGNIIAHNGTMTSLYKAKSFKHPVHQKLYEQQLFALGQVDMATRMLWACFHKQQAIDFQKIIKDIKSRNVINSNTTPYFLRDFDVQKLLTNNFVSWFHESLFEHFPEKNFFAGKATPEWFEKASEYYAKGKVFEYSKNRFEIIRDDHLQPVAIYKHLINQSQERNARNRQIKVEYVSWLIAKTMGLTDVVNPVIPVRKTATGFFIDPFNYDGSLEPIAGPILKDEKNSLNSYGKLKELLSGVLCHSGHYFIERNISWFQKERTLFFSPSLISYSHYFSGEPNPFAERDASFFDSFRANDPANRIKDLKAFRDSISLKHLWEIMLFWYITLQEDMNPSNILYVPNQRGQIIPTVIDYDIALGRDYDIGKRIPLIYTLPQINQVLPRDFLSVISSFPERKLTRILEMYKRAAPKEKASEFTPQDTEQLLERLNFLKEKANTTKPPSLKEMMLALIETRNYSPEDIFLSQASNLVGATLLSPLKFSGFKQKRPTKSAKNLGDIKLYNIFSVVNVPTFKLPWIFEVTEKEQLRPLPDRDYMPLKEVSSLYEELLGNLRETKEEDKVSGKYAHYMNDPRPIKPFEDIYEKFQRNFKTPKDVQPREPRGGDMDFLYGKSLLRKL